MGPGAEVHVSVGTVLQVVRVRAGSAQADTQPLVTCHSPRRPWPSRRLSGCARRTGPLPSHRVWSRAGLGAARLGPGEWRTRTDSDADCCGPGAARVRPGCRGTASGCRGPWGPGREIRLRLRARLPFSVRERERERDHSSKPAVVVSLADRRRRGRPGPGLWIGSSRLEFEFQADRDSDGLELPRLLARRPACRLTGSPPHAISLLLHRRAARPKDALRCNNNGITTMQ
jgi:hypothetical protein